jgi:hypothetical protein
MESIARVFGVFVRAANQEILHFVKGDSPRQKKAPYQKYGAF